MREISSSSLSENFDSPISHKGSCESGEEPKVFSGTDSPFQPGSTLLVLSLQTELENTTLKEYESVLEEQIISLHETEVRSRQIFWKNVRAALNFIIASDDLSSFYIAIERLAAAMLSVTGVVAYVHWRLQYEVNAILAFIQQCERRIVKLNPETNALAEENSSLKSYIESLKKTQERMPSRPVENTERRRRTEDL